MPDVAAVSVVTGQRLGRRHARTPGVSRRAGQSHRRPRGGGVYVRRWSVSPLPSDANLLAVQVSVAPCRTSARRRPMRRHQRPRPPGQHPIEGRVVGVRRCRRVSHLPSCSWPRPSPSWPSAWPRASCIRCRWRSRRCPRPSDAQQRLRVAAQTLAEDIMAAGAGPVPGWGGRAVPAWPAVLPCRSAGEPLGTRPDGCARAGRHQRSWRCPLPLLRPSFAEDLAAAGGAIRVRSAFRPARFLTRPAAFTTVRARSWPTVSGAWDVVPITAVSIDGLTLEHAGSHLTRVYRAGALIGEADSSAYSLRFDPATGALSAAPLDRRVGGHAAARPRHGPALRVLRTRRTACRHRRRRRVPPAGVLRTAAASGRRGRPARRVATR